MKDEERTYIPLDQILDELPHLAMIGWNVKYLAVICRMKLLVSQIDPATKEYKTTIGSVKRALELRKNELIRDALDSIAEED